MKQLKLERGKEDLISTGGNYLCGHILRLHAQADLPENFQSRRSGAISDRDVLMAMTGILCDGRSDFTNINLYAGDAVFAHTSGSESCLRKRPCGSVWTNCRRIVVTAGSGN